MGVKERLKKFVKYKNLTNQKFELEAGLSNGYIANMRKGVGDRALEQISNKFPDLNIGWLLTGEGEMLKSEPQAAPSGSAIPFYNDMVVTAGQAEPLVLNGQPGGWVDLPGVKAKALFPVVGCSMQPEINPGDIIGVVDISNWEYIDPDKVYLVITSDDRMIKHLATDETDDEILWCVSPNYPKFKIRKEDIKYLYRVSFVGKMF